MANFFCKESDEVRLCGPRGKIELFCKYFITREKPTCTDFIKNIVTVIEYTFLVM